MTESGFESDNDVVLVAVARQGQRVDGQPREIRLQAGDTLLLECPPKGDERLENNNRRRLTFFDSHFVPQIGRSSFDINVKFNSGTPFQKKVWSALNSIPFGSTASYEDIALRLTEGKLTEARKITRAVGAACSDNPVAVIVPCHRVIGKDGSIVGYSAGIDIKDYLLLHETFTAVTPLISKEV